jgi:LysM repeat protein
MKATPPRQVEGKQAAWIIPLLATLVSATTILGAVLLSLQGQTPDKHLIVQASQDVMADVIPTADIATVPPLTAIPTWDTIETPFEVSLTPVILATTVSPVLVSATALPSTSTPLPCAGGAPLHWKLYVVQWGDTLFSLTRRHGTTVQDAIFYNCLQSENVRAGQRLYLPSLPTPVPFTPSPMPSFTPAPIIPTQSPPQPTLAPTQTATPSPLPTVGATATLVPTATATVSPTATLTPAPVISPTATLTPAPVISPTATLTPEPVISPTATLTPEPVISPTITLMPEPVISPTATLTPEPVASPTLEPSPTP